MQSSNWHIHSHQHHHPYIKTVTYPPRVLPKHAPRANHPRILTHFFLPSSSGSIAGSAGLMQFKVTKASSAAHLSPPPGAINKLKHSLYDDPAFSADPAANPLCAASHDISPWITEPPKGHPVIRPREVHPDVQSGEVTLIQPPNSPVYLHAQTQPITPMTQPSESILVSSPPTSVPDLSSTASSASDSSLPTPSASHLSLGATMTSAPPPANNKKRIGFPFFSRKPASGSTADSSRPPVNMPLTSATHAINSAPPLQNQHQTKSSLATAPMPSQASRGYQRPNGSARELDMIDELDETNPLGVALHHGGPYEAIQKMAASRTQAQQIAYTPNQQPSTLYREQFRFDMPLNLSPGQILPHSATARYRPRAAPVGNVQERIDFGAPAVNRVVSQGGPPPPNHRTGSAPKQYSAADPTSRHLDHLSPYNSRGVASGSLHHHSSSDPVVLPYDDRLQTPNARPPRVPPPQVGGNYPSTVNNVRVAVGALHYDSTGEARAFSEQEQYAYDDRRKQRVAHSGNAQMPHTNPAYNSNAEARPQGFPDSFQRPSPPHLERIGPPINQDQHRQWEPRPGPVHQVPESHPSMASSSSTLRSSASSVTTATTNATSVGTSRNRILPKQLVMPAPLAKAAASSRPLPTQPQQQQHWPNLTQHHVRFGDGTEYALPVTNTSTTTPIPPTSQLPRGPAQPPTRTLSVPRSGKLKKRPSFHGPEPPEIMARLANAPAAMHKGRYMEPPPTIPEAPRIEMAVRNAPVKQEVKRLLSKRRSAF